MTNEGQGRKVLVTGGAGVMGRRLCTGLMERGFEMVVLDRPGTKLEDDRIDLRHGDITDPSSLKGLFDGVDTVYHLAAVLLPPEPSMYESVNIVGTQNVVNAAREAGVKHFVHVSSASVVYDNPTRYSLSKREGERIVRENGVMEWTIIRPTLVYDEHGGIEFARYFDYLKKFPVVPFIGLGHALKNPVHTEDIMNGLIAIAGNAKSFGEVYAFSGGRAVPIWTMSKMMLRHRGIKKLFIPMPVWFARGIAWVLEQFMNDPPLKWQMVAGIIQDADLDHSNATEHLGYRPMTIDEGFEKTWPLRKA